MSQKISDTFNEILEKLNIQIGDSVYLSVDMGKVPLPKIKCELSKKGIREREKKWCEFIFEGIQKKIGSEGTLLVPTFSYEYARDQKPFSLENTPSETGIFTESIRLKKKSVRSLHPIFSVSGVGKNAKLILNNVGKSSYGLASPFMRLASFKTKFVFLGTTLRNLTYFHHLEHLYGVNHMYHKLFNTPVYAEGKKIPGPWLAFVRYLDFGVIAQIENLEKILKEKGLLREYIWQGHHHMQSVEIDNIDKVATGMLKELPWSCIKESIEVKIEGRKISFSKNE